MGAVWLATRNDGRFTGQVAVKLLHPALATGDGEARFRLEADLLARLTHPQISRLYDAGVTATGQPYLVLAYVAGRPIDQWCADHHASQERRLDLVRQMLRTVVHAHAQGVIHGDLKPSNVLVDDDGIVTLLDFGIARLAGDGAASDSGPLASNAFTPRYASPEQVSGALTTTASDVYSAAVLTYELLAGRHPTSEPGATRRDVLRGITAHEPAPLPASVPRAIHHVLRKALAKAPVDRYATAQALLDDLERVARHAPTIAHPGTGLERAHLFVRRHAAAVAATSVVVLAIGAVVAVTVWQLGETRRQRDAARDAATQASVMAQVLEAGYGELEAPDTTFQQTQRLLRIRDILGASGASRPLRARLLLGLGGQLGSIGQFTIADSLHAEALTTAESADDPALLASALCVKAARFIGVLGDSAQTIFDRAYALLASAGPDEDDARAACDGRLAMAMSARMALDSARDVIQRAVARRVANGDSVSATYLTLLEAGVVSSRYGPRPDLAVQDAERLQRAYERTGRRHDITAVKNLGAIISLRMELGDVPTADSVAQVAVQRLGGEAAIDRAPLDLLMSLADMSFDAPGRTPTVTWYRRALQAAERGGEHRAAMNLRMAVSEALSRRGERQSARLVYDSAVGEVASRGGPAQRVMLAFLRARLLTGEGRPDLAAPILDSVMGAHGYPDQLRMIGKKRYLLRYVSTLTAAGRYADAAAALRLIDRLYPVPESTIYGSSLLMNRAEIAWGTGARDSAIVLARRALSAKRQLYPAEAEPILIAEALVTRIERGALPPVGSRALAGQLRSPPR
ncbi:MAG: serine/threonine protein kinase [Gemmatimonadaceae bacterium]|nr:serine/threonine protein kinase [Gemmatimonadaceae bacterium]